MVFNWHGWMEQEEVVVKEGEGLFVLLPGCGGGGGERRRRGWREEGEKNERQGEAEKMGQGHSGRDRGGTDGAA